MGGLDRFYENKKKTDNEGSYLKRLPSFPDVPPETELIALDTTLRFRLMQTGCSKGERAAVVMAVGNVAYQRNNEGLYHTTFGDIRSATVEDLTKLPGVRERTANILKIIVG